MTTTPPPEGPPREGVTAGYDPETDRWHVEVHQPGMETETIGISFPLEANQETARQLAEQIAGNRKLPHIEDNRGLSPASDVLAQIRHTAWMAGEDDPALVAEIAALRDAQAAAVDAGWTRVTNPATVVSATSSLVQYDAAGIPVYSLPGINDSSMVRFDLTTLPTLALFPKPGSTTVMFPPEHARALGAALIAAAKTAEELSQLADARVAGKVTDIPPTKL